MRSLALSFLLLLSVGTAEARVHKFRTSPSSIAESTREFLALEDPFPNELCQAANVLEFAALDGIRSIPVNADYCELPAARLPREVVAVLARLRGIHARYADAFGRAPTELFGAGVRIHIAEHPSGPLASFSSRQADGLDNVEIDVFKDFRAERFPDRIYVHELTHLLLIQERLGASARDLETSYLFFESFPDLVSSVVTKSPKIDFADPTVRKALTFARDGSPIRSMKRPFRDFYLGRFQTDKIEVCAKTDAKTMTANEKALCRHFRAEAAKTTGKNSLYADAKDRVPTAAELNAPFRPERCLIHYKNGTVGADACFKNALGPVWISFFRSMGSLLGTRPLVALLAAINDAGRTPEFYTCAFTGETAKNRNTESSTVSFSSVMRALKSLREGLTPSARKGFDRAWAEHGLDAWAKLERYDREYVVAAFAYQMLVKSNEAFSVEFGCDSSIPALRGPKCASVCTYLGATGSGPP